MTTQTADTMLFPALTSLTSAVITEPGVTEQQQTVAFEDLAEAHRLYEARVFRFLLYSVRDRDVAMTLTQDTFLAAWRARSSFRGDCSEATWLMRIAVNLLRNHVRTSRFRFWQRVEDVAAVDLASPLRDAAPSAETSLAFQQQVAEVWKVADSLSAKQKTVFLLRFVEEMEVPEIAAATGMSLATTKTHLHRATEHVRAAVRKGRN